MPTETTKAQTTPRDFFLHLGVIVTLYTSAVSLLALLFQVIDYKFRDALSESMYYGSYYYDPYSSAVRIAIASLVIAFPLFCLLTGMLNGDYRKDPQRKTIWVRRWLVYLTLFLAGVTIMIDLIMLVNTFLGGEITVRFVLKVLAVLIVTGLIFGYYIYDLKHYPTGPSRALKKFLIIAGAFILLSIACGFAVLGSPSDQRKLQFDSQRANDLQNVQQQVVSYWQRKQALPQNLSDLKDPIYNSYLPVDPETRVDYEYRATGSLSFEVCATFSMKAKTPSIGGPGSMPRSMVAPTMYKGWDSNDIYMHDAGRQCFARTIDPELYPPINGTVQKGSVPIREGTTGPDYYPNGQSGVAVPEQM